MLRLRLTFKGTLAMALAFLALLLGAALDHPYLNLGGYALLGVMLMAAFTGYLAIRQVRITAVAVRGTPMSTEAEVWVGLDARRTLGPFGLDVDGHAELERLVQAPDRGGQAFHLPEPPETLFVALRGLPLGLVEITRRVPVAWLPPAAESSVSVPEARPLVQAAELDGRIREHRPGEGLRQVHWPLSARLQRLIVRVQASEVEHAPRPAWHRESGQRGERPAPRLELLRASTLAATLAAIAFLWLQGALAAPAAMVLFPLVLLGGIMSLRRAGRPSPLLLLALYVGILAILGWFVSDMRSHVLARGPIALTVMSVAALFAWDLRDRSYIRAQLFLLVFAAVLLPAFFAPRDDQGLGVAFVMLMITLLLAAWTEGRHALGASSVRLSELGSLTSALMPLAFFAAMVLILHPWLPAIPLPSLPTFGLSQSRTAESQPEAQVPGQHGRVNLDARWTQGSRPVVEVQGGAERLRTEVYAIYREGEWVSASVPAAPWPEAETPQHWMRLTLRADAMRLLPLPAGTVALREALLEPTRYADGTVRLSRPAWNGYAFEVGLARSPRDERQVPPSPERLGEGSMLPGLGLMARDLAAEASTPLEALQRMTENLRTQFRYDLQAPEAPAGVDPVWYFLTESRSGFCVHFASALALMGRELGIPTRFVGGYVGGRAHGDVTIFEERHAHAWVEAYVDGRWITLDPTPGSRMLPSIPAERARMALAGLLLVAGGLIFWFQRREPGVLRQYRAWLKRLERRGLPITEATTSREALALARAHLEARDWERFRDLLQRYEVERFR